MERTQLKAELEKYRECDPEVIEEMSEYRPVFSQPLTFRVTLILPLECVCVEILDTGHNVDFSSEIKNTFYKLLEFYCDCSLCYLFKFYILFSKMFFKMLYSDEKQGEKIQFSNIFSSKSNDQIFGFC